MHLLNLANSAPKWVSDLATHLPAAIVYTLFGVVVFAIAFVTMCKLTPFSVRKEIEEDQNTSLAIIMGSVVIGLAIIIAAAVLYLLFVFHVTDGPERVEDGLAAPAEAPADAPAEEDGD